MFPFAPVVRLALVFFPQCFQYRCSLLLRLLGELDNPHDSLVDPMSHQFYLKNCQNLNSIWNTSPNYWLSSVNSTTILSSVKSVTFFWFFATSSSLYNPNIFSSFPLTLGQLSFAWFYTNLFECTFVQLESQAKHKNPFGQILKQGQNSASFERKSKSKLG